DKDPLTYSLLESTPGMSIDSTSGVINWPNPAAGVKFAFAGSAGSTGDDRGRGVATDADGNVYMTGFFSGPTDFDLGPGTFVLTPHNTTKIDSFVAKYSRSGQLLWARQAGGLNASVFADAI